MKTKIMTIYLPETVHKFAKKKSTRATRRGSCPNLSRFIEDLILKDQQAKAHTQGKKNQEAVNARMAREAAAKNAGYQSELDKKRDALKLTEKETELRKLAETHAENLLTGEQKRAEVQKEINDLLAKAAATKDASAADAFKIEAAKKQNELDKLHTAKATKGEREHNEIDRMGGVAIGEKLGAAPKSEQHLAKLVTQNDIMIGLFRRVVAKAADERAYLASMRGPGGGFE